VAGNTCPKTTILPSGWIATSENCTSPTASATRPSPSKVVSKKPGCAAASAGMARRTSSNAAQRSGRTKRDASDMGRPPKRWVGLRAYRGKNPDAGATTAMPSRRLSGHGETARMRVMPSVQAVLFDFGGVFMESPFAAVRDFGAGLGIDPQRALELLFGPYDRDTDHPWHRLERGELSLLEARQAIFELGDPEERIDLFAALGSLRNASVRADMIEIAREARARGVKTAIVTNNVREFGDAWRSMLPLDELFDAVVDSAHVGMRKPDPRIFQLALERLGGVPPEQAVFLDDFQGNVAAAERVGIRGILVEEDPRPAMKALRALLA
jgi:epoxide hydrolase-like predicted phosphatase